MGTLGAAPYSYAYENGLSQIIAAGQQKKRFCDSAKIMNIIGKSESHFGYLAAIFSETFPVSVQFVCC